MQSVTMCVTMTHIDFSFYRQAKERQVDDDGTPSKSYHFAIITTDNTHYLTGNSESF